jgi:hypothetical protein
MNWRDWKNWMNEKPILLRWFVWLVLLRPIIDNFYYLKEISPLLSPLYIVGVLTPVLCLIVILKYRVRPQTEVDRYFGFWSMFVLSGCFFLFLYEPFSLAATETVLKLSMPVYLFYFLRRFITSRRDLEGLLQTVLYAALIVALVLVYELVAGPIRNEESRGMARIQGNFGDVVSYGIYISLALLASGYFFFKKRTEALGTKRALTGFVAVVVVSVLALVNMHHVASYTVFASIMGLFMLYNYSVNKGMGIALMLLAGVSVIYFGQDIFDQNIAPLIETDLKVYAGEQETGRLLHGRVGRWIFMFELLSEQGVFPQLFGYPLTFEYAYHLVGIGAHNDFIRMLFFTGYAGLFFYVLLLFRVWRRQSILMESQKFLLTGVLLTTLLFSVSTTPTMYAPFAYILMSIFAFVALPERKGGSFE